MLPNETILAECKEFDAEIWSDLHKDTYGYRPRWDMSHYTAAELDALWVRTCDLLDEVIDEEERAQIEAELDFDTRLAQMQSLGASDRKTAFRWLAQADGVDFDDLQWAGQFCYQNGLPYSMESELLKLAA